MIRPVISLGAHLEHMGSDELFDLADLMEQLQSHPGWEALQEVTERGRENARKSMELGQVLSRAEYARWMGFLNGATLQADIAREVIKAASERRRELERAAQEERDRQAEREAEGVEA